MGLLSKVGEFLTGVKPPKARFEGNSIMVLRPYNYYGSWVFDDDRVGLVREPFVQGIPEILEAALAEAGVPLEEAGKGFLLTFAGSPFPGDPEPGQVTLKRLYPESGGNWYEDQHGRKGWLCPALYKYFPEAPDLIHCKVSRQPL